jgi:hypothetical protein
MPFLSAYSIFANSNLFLYIKKDTQKMGVYFGLAQKERFPRLAFALADRHPDSEQSTGLF